MSLPLCAASIAGIAKYLPAVAGLLLEKEIKTLGSILENPARPFTSLLGGAKVSDKVGMLENIMDKVDCLLIGGGMAALYQMYATKQLEFRQPRLMFPYDPEDMATRYDNNVEMINQVTQNSFDELVLDTDNEEE